MKLLRKEVLTKIRARSLGNAVRASVILHDWA